MVRMVVDSGSSVSRAQNTLTKALYLKRISKLLEDEPEQLIKRVRGVAPNLCQTRQFSHTYSWRVGETKKSSLSLEGFHLQSAICRS